jgi:hypothetical protein
LGTSLGLASIRIHNGDTSYFVGHGETPVGSKFWSSQRYQVLDQVEAVPSPAFKIIWSSQSYQVLDQVEAVPWAGLQNQQV